ncbi:hypothetical protein G9A89_021991 [Geosiphon pyriformis]|nr:hypothetical protein G9A89_021991 [Geosiphon pyriformis]
MLGLFKSPFLPKTKLLAHATYSRQLSLTPFVYSRFTELTSHVRKHYPISEISPKELDESLASQIKPVVIDVRENDEQLAGIIPGAILLPRGVLERDVERKVVSVEEVNGENGKNVVIYCAGGVRSILAAESLIRLGYKKENIKSLSGGYDEWKNNGFKVENYGNSEKD